jgi:hypothetical protein
MDIKRVEKPWGHELWWAHAKLFVGKLLHVKAGHQLSLQYHVKGARRSTSSPACRCRCSTRARALVEEILRPGESHRIVPTRCTAWSRSPPATSRPKWTTWSGSRIRTGEVGARG